MAHSSCNGPMHIIWDWWKFIFVWGAILFPLLLLSQWLRWLLYDEKWLVVDINIMETPFFVKQIICGLIEPTYRNELMHARGLLVLS
jgi:hypothetical protein